MRRAVQLGQIPRRLQLNATTISSRHLATHAREAVREDAAPQVRGELAFDVARKPAALGGDVAQLGEQRLRVPGDQLVQHGSLRRTPTVTTERLSGRAGRPFVQAAGGHVPAL
jgi:hypothetical protein